jgi:cytochrome oxidase assembly protein ShyY1
MKRFILLSGVVVFSIVFFFVLAGWQFSKYRIDTKQAGEFNSNLNKHIDVSSLYSQKNSKNELLYKQLNYRGVIVTDQAIILVHRQFSDSPGSELLYPLSLPNNEVILLDLGWFPNTYSNSQMLEDIRGLSQDNRMKEEWQCRIYEIENGYKTKKKERMKITQLSNERIIELSSLDKSSLVELSKPLKREVIDQYYCVAVKPLLGDGAPPYVVDKISYKYGPYLSYTVQWLIFSVVVLGIYTRYLLLPFLRRKEGAKRNK